MAAIKVEGMVRELSRKVGELEMRIAVLENGAPDAKPDEPQKSGRKKASTKKR